MICRKPWPRSTVYTLKSSKNINPYLLEGEHDGVVTVEGGQVEGIKRLEVVDADHTFIMGEKLVLKRIAELLKQ